MLIFANCEERRAGFQSAQSVAGQDKEPVLGVVYFAVCKRGDGARTGEDRRVSVCCVALAGRTGQTE